MFAQSPRFDGPTAMFTWEPDRRKFDGPTAMFTWEPDRRKFDGPTAMFTWAAAYTHLTMPTTDLV